MEIVRLRKEILLRKDYINTIKQLSWKLKKAEELYPLESNDPKILRILIGIYDDIFQDFMYLARLELGLEDYSTYPEGGVV